ncbi:MAG: thiamine biosynthesis protein ThiF [Campylobacterota bacterium]|nr:thiamine biosynthesis protein ThiF [Campylobacterota bacterium]
MMDGFDLESPLVCEGIIGDGCGGGRIFFIEETCLKVYDPTSKESILLFEDINKPKSITKDGCIIFIECESETIQFDLSALQKN